MVSGSLTGGPPPSTADAAVADAEPPVAAGATDRTAAHAALRSTPSSTADDAAAPGARWHCRVCGSTGPFSRHSVREMMFGSGQRFEYLLCGGAAAADRGAPSAAPPTDGGATAAVAAQGPRPTGCGCLQIADPPADLARHYGPGYYSYGPRPVARGLRGLFARARNRHLAGRVDPLGRWLARRRPFLALAAVGALRPARDARIVDVGCGGGELLLALQSAGFTRLVGCDPFVAHDLDLGGGLVVRKAALHELAGPVDLVMFHHALEHIADQHGSLRAAHALLAPGGRCLVRIPTVGSWAWRHYGVDWCALDAPRHLVLHSRASIRLLAERCGFRVERIGDDSTAFQVWGSEQYRRGIALMRPGSHDIVPAPGAFTAAELAAAGRRARDLNAAGDGDQIVVVLRRPA